MELREKHTPCYWGYINEYKIPCPQGALNLAEDSETYVN